MRIKFIGWMVTLLLLGQNVPQISPIEGTKQVSSESITAQVQEEKMPPENSAQLVESHESTEAKTPVSNTKETEKEPRLINETSKSQNQALLAGDTEENPIIVDSALATTITGKFYKLIAGGSINTVVSGSKIVEMSGGTITGLSGSIGVFTGGTVVTMNLGSVIEILSGGTITNCSGNVKTLTGDGKITNLHGNVETMSGGSIRALSGSVTTMNGGNITYTMFFSQVFSMNGGVIESHEAGATIAQLNGGTINKSYGNITSMTDGLVVYYQGMIPAEENRGTAIVLHSPVIEALIKNVSNHVYDGTAPYDFQNQNQWGEIITFTYNDKETPPIEAGQAYTVKANVNYQGSIVTSIIGGTFEITPKDLSVSDIKVADKIYDGKTIAAISEIELNGIVSTDSGKVSVDTQKSKAVLDRKDVGASVSGKVESSNIVLTGEKAHNYKLVDNQSQEITIKISPFQITNEAIVFAGQFKSYDGEVDANLTGTFKAGIVQSNDSNVPDDLSLEIKNAKYPDARIGNDKQITYDCRLLGNDSANYLLEGCPQVIGGISEPIVTDEILKNIVQEVHKQEPQKKYDGTTKGQFTLDISDQFASTAVEVIELLVHGEYESKAVGSRTFTVTSWEVKDDKAKMKEVPVSLVISGKIEPKPITLVWTAKTKAYDGNEVVAVHGIPNGIVADDIVSFTGEGSFANKHVGTDKTVSISNILASGKDAGNYSYPSNGTALASITPKQLQAVWRSKEKIYDGKRDALVSVEPLGILINDEVTVSGTGTFSDDKVEENKSISIKVTTAGKDSQNYSIEAEAATTGTIRPKMLTITGVKAVDRVLSDSLLVDLDGSQAKLLGVVSKDQNKVGFSLNSGTIQNPDIGQNKPVQTAIALNGEAAGNYQLTQPSLRVNILSQESNKKQVDKPQQPARKADQQAGKIQATTKKTESSKLLKAGEISDQIMVWTGLGTVGLVGALVWLKRKFYR